MKLLDLFSGIGGFSYGLENLGFKTVAFCEMDKYCKLVLQKHWKGVKIYNDVKEITKERLKADGVEAPDIITGGFPCQPFSVAGKQKGTSDDRYLWPEMFRIIKELKPRWVIGENVKGLVNLQNGLVFETVCTDLEGEGYEVRAFNIPAAGVGAPHRRERIWIVAVNVANSYERSSSSQKHSSTFDRQNKGLRSNNENLRRRDENVEDSNNNGHEGGLTEARNQVSSRQESKINGSTNTNISSRRSNGRGDNEQSRVDGEVQRLQDGNEKESTRATGVRELYERTNINQGVAREDRNQEDDSRALVQEGQSRVQSSIDRRLEQDQTAFEDNQIRQRDDSTSLNRMETGKDENVSNSKSERLQRSRGQESDRNINGFQQNKKGIKSEIRSESERRSRTFRDEDVANSRRTLRQGTELREKNENETRKENADQHQRSSSSPEPNVANTESIESYVGKHRKHQTEGNGQSETRGKSSEDVADTYTRLSDGTYEEVQSRGQTFDTSSEGSTDVANANSERQQEQCRTESVQKEGNEPQRSSSQARHTGWQSEPDVGRVANGVPGRVHRLKALGNSIVPKIAEEIGRAIMKAENEVE